MKPNSQHYKFTEYVFQQVSDLVEVGVVSEKRLTVEHQISIVHVGIRLLDCLPDSLYQLLTD